MKTANAQRGMTLIGWLFLLAVIGFLAIIALRLTPGYMEYFTIAQAMEQAHTQSSPESTIAQVREALLKRFVINNVKTIRAHDIKITRVDGEFTLSVAYEYRTPIVGNVDAILVFEKVVGGE